MNKQARSGAAASAQQIATEARTALLRSDFVGASALVDVAHVYALIASGQPVGAERADPAPVVARVPAPPVPVDFPAPQLALRMDTGAASGEQFDGSTSEALVDESGEVSVPRDPNTGVPTLLVRAHEAIVRAGGKMYSADLAAHLGMDTQKLGTVLTKLLREVGVSRPGNGMVSIARGKPFRTGFIADTLATGIAAYRVRATSAAA
ncbi:hypothetical protein [uncultured Streptomyces sp.]|uniref:hypothetical protein n=1 Tax=uncultured Streptomyces sp. TaxID=174707 RepID=UPI00263047A6|nr:hypothetical protein [uncultured Streptomyces sp.]